MLVELSQQPVPHSLLLLCPSREGKVEVKRTAASKGNKSYKISSVKVEKVSDGYRTLCFHNSIRKGFAEA